MSVRADIRELHRALGELPADETLRVRAESRMIGVVGRAMAGVVGVVGVVIGSGVCLWLGTGARVPPAVMATAFFFSSTLPLLASFGLGHLVQMQVRGRLRRGLAALERREAPRLSGVGASSSVAVPAAVPRATNAPVGRR